MHYSWHHLVASVTTGQLMSLPCLHIGHFVNPSHISSVQLLCSVRAYRLICGIAYYCISSLSPPALMLFAGMAFPPKNIWVLACPHIWHFPLTRPTPLTG